MRNLRAIITKYHGPTNFEGSRYSASDCDGNRVTIECDYSLNSDENHARAARTLCEQMGWKGHMIGGWTKDGMTWVFSNSTPQFNV